MAQRTCAACGRSYVAPPRRDATAYCSEACRVWSYGNPGKPRIVPAVCSYCGGAIVQPRMKKVYCSKLCRVRARAGVPIQRPTKCPECGQVFTPASAHQRYCTTRCSKTAYNRQFLIDHPDKAMQYRQSDAIRAAWRRRRAQKRGATVEKFTVREIFERDVWRCHLCRRTVRQDLKYPHSMSASLDHLIPLALGGEHSRANVRLAHLSCNLRKRIQPLNEQLLLIG